MTRVLIVATSAVMRAGLEALLTQSPTIVIVGSVARTTALDGNHDLLSDEIESHEPDVVLLAIDDRREIRQPTSLGRLSPDADGRAPALVLLGDARDTGWMMDALRGGVSAVLPPDAPPAAIVAAIEGAGAGLVALSRDAMNALLAGAPRAAAPELNAPPSQPLTPREAEILQLLAEGLGNKMVAARLGISEHTVKTHIASVFTKLDVYTRAEAVARGIRIGAILL